MDGPTAVCAADSFSEVEPELGRNRSAVITAVKCAEICSQTRIIGVWNNTWTPAEKC